MICGFKYSVFIVKTMLTFTCLLTLIQFVKSNGIANKAEINNNSTTQQNKCLDMTVPLCMDMGYNLTTTPNLLKQNQKEAVAELNEYMPLISINCSPDLLTFLCSVYVPDCSASGDFILPRRSVCLSSRSGCEAIIEAFGNEWPESFDCMKFPEDPNPK